MITPRAVRSLAHRRGAATAGTIGTLEALRKLCMSDVITDPSLPQAYFDDAAGVVYLWVRTAAGIPMGAMLRKEVLHFRFGAAMSGVDALKTYQHHRAQIEATVLRRIAGGSIEPVLLRESDFGTR